MTTIIIIIVAAWIFFTAAYVFMFIEWKDEASRRAEKLREIEEDLKDMDSRLIALAASMETLGKMEAIRREVSSMNRFRYQGYEGREQKEDRPSPRREVMDISAGKNRTDIKENEDPFKWVREKKESRPADDREAPESSEGAVAAEPAEREEISPRETAADTEKSESVESNKPAPLDSRTEETAEQEKAREEAGNNMEETTSEAAAEPEEHIEAAAEKEQIRHYEKEENPQTEKYDEIDLDFIDDEYQTFSLSDNQRPGQKPAGRDVGRSGKRYTAEELEELIKE